MREEKKKMCFKFHTRQKKKKIKKYRNSHSHPHTQRLCERFLTLFDPQYMRKKCEKNRLRLRCKKSFFLFHIQIFDSKWNAFGHLQSIGDFLRIILCLRMGQDELREVCLWCYLSFWWNIWIYLMFQAFFKFSMILRFLSRFLGM